MVRVILKLFYVSVGNLEYVRKIGYVLLCGWFYDRIVKFLRKKCGFEGVKNKYRY